MDPFNLNPPKMEYYTINEEGKILYKDKNQKEPENIEKTKGQVKKIGSSKQNKTTIEKRVTQNGPSIDLEKNPVISTSQTSSKSFAKKELSSLMIALNEKKSYTERQEVIRKLTEIILERVPLIVKEMSEGSSDPALEFFHKVVVSLSDDPEAKTFVKAFGIIFSNMLAIQLTNEIEKCRQDLEIGKGSKGELESRIKHLTEAMTSFFGEDLEKFQEIKEKGFEEASEKLLRLFPETGGAVNNSIKWLSEYSGSLKIFPMAYGVIGANKAMELLDYIGVLLNKQKQQLAESGQKSESELISKQEKEIEKLKNEMEKRAFQQDITGGGYTIKAFREAVDWATKLLPKKPEFEMFKLAFHGLGMGASSISMALPGTSILSRIKRISAVQEEVNHLEKICNKLEKEINGLTNELFDENKLNAKKKLLVILQIKQQTLRWRVIPMQAWLLVEDTTSLGKSGKKFTVDFLSFMGVRGAYFGVLGGIGTGLSLASGTLWSVRTLLTDRALLSKWKGKLDLYLSDRALKNEIMSLQSWVKEFADRVLPIEGDKEFTIEELVKLFAHENLKIEKELGLVNQNLINLQGQALAKALDRINRLETAKKALNEIDNAIFFSGLELSQLSGKDLLPFKNLLLEAFGELAEFSSLKKEKETLEKRSLEHEEIYKKARKHQQHFWEENEYIEFSKDLQSALEDPHVSNEFQNLMRKHYKEPYEKIFQNKEKPNIEKMMDFIFPDTTK